MYALVVVEPGAASFCSVLFCAVLCCPFTSYVVVSSLGAEMGAWRRERCFLY